MRPLISDETNETITGVIKIPLTITIQSCLTGAVRGIIDANVKYIHHAGLGFIVSSLLYILLFIYGKYSLFSYGVEINSTTKICIA